MARFCLWRELFILAAIKLPRTGFRLQVMFFETVTEMFLKVFADWTERSATAVHGHQVGHILEYLNL